jgi:hypothetical protein
MATHSRSARAPRIRAAHLLAAGLLVGAAGLFGLARAQSATAPVAAPVGAQLLSNQLAGFARAGGFPVGTPRVGRLSLSRDEEEAFASAGIVGGIGGLSLKGGEIQLSPATLRAARRVARRGGVTVAPFQLVKLLLHEQLHQVSWRKRDSWYPLGSPERVRDEGATEAAAWILARVWCARPATHCTGNRSVTPAYRSRVSRMRRMAIDGSGARRHTDRAARVWLRAYLRGDDARREALRREALRRREAR